VQLDDASEYWVKTQIASPLEIGAANSVILCGSDSMISECNFATASELPVAGMPVIRQPKRCRPAGGPAMPGRDRDVASERVYMRGARQHWQSQ
jgi:hypothetical protein